MENYDSIFGFETDFAGTLRCIPMCVRLKLDRCGIKLSLKQWNRISAVERRQLVTMPCEAAANIGAYKTLVVRLIGTWTSSKAEELPVDRAPAWEDTSGVPERLSAHAASLSVAPPSAAQWASLTPLQRFALFKLTRPGHSNDNFIPALREFGILEDSR